MTKKEAASRGGNAVYQKYGSSYMAKIGRRGAERFYEKYDLVPVEQTKFAIVNKQTGKVVGYRS